MSNISGMIAQGGQTLMSVYAMKKQGEAGRAAAERNNAEKEFQAEEDEQDAGQQIAASQRAALEENRQATLVASRSLAVAAASGGAASDRTVVNLLAKTRGEGALRAGVAMYQGEEAARQLNQKARILRYEGAVGEEIAYQEQKVGNAMAVANVWGGFGSIGSSMYTKYGGDNGYKSSINTNGGPGGYNGYTGGDSSDDSSYSGGTAMT